MRRTSIIVLLALSAACDTTDQVTAPPLERFYFPSGIAYVADPASTELASGTLYVVSSDFDKRYDFGAVTALDLSRLATQLPALGTVAEGGPVQITELGIDASQQILIAPMGGQLATFPRGGNGVRLFVPSRAEDDRLFAIDAVGTSLNCVGAAASERNCVTYAPSLTRPGINEEEGFSKGLPRAPEPFGVAVRDNEVYVTHLSQADSPYGSRENLQSFVVRLDAENPNLTASSFISIGTQPSNSVAIGDRYAFVSGRRVSSTLPPAIRLIDRLNPGRVLEAGIQGDYRILESRGIAEWQGNIDGLNREFLFLAGRSPDVMLTIEVDRTNLEQPRLVVVGQANLPQDPTEVVLIERGGGQGPLLAVTSSGAKSLSLYNGADHRIETSVFGVGEQPFGIAVQKIISTTGVESARLFVSNFGDGRVAVIDVPDLSQPFNARLVAHLGAAQTCLANPDLAECVEDGI